MDVRAAIVAWPQEAPRGAVTRFCRDHGVSRSQFYEICARVAAEGAVAAMAYRPRSRRVRHSQAVPVAIEELAVKIRKELAEQGWDHGPVTVRQKLLELGVRAPACSTLARIFTARGMVVAQPQKRPKSSLWRRFEAGAVHECWQLDGFEWALLDGTAFVILQLTDDKSRHPIASRAAPGERSADAIAVVQTGIDRFQVPCRLLTDNGAAFNRERLGKRTQLVAYLKSLGCTPITGRPDHPQTQGKNERAHQTLQRWLRARPAPATLQEAQRLLDEYDAAFAKRAHQALGMRTPAEVLASGPTAIAPVPPRPTPAGANGPALPVARCYQVARNGNMHIGKATVHLDPPQRGTTVTVVHAGLTLTIFDEHGRYLRTVNLQPGRTYYSNGRPRGPHWKPA